MTIRSFSSSIVCALAFALVAAPTFLAHAQAPAAAPADASSSNAAPAAPAAPAATPAPAAAAPSDTTAPVAAPADTNAATATTPAERPSTYTIVKGDSLWKIAHEFGTTVVQLRKANKLKKGALLHPGQVLQIPPATSDTTTK
jgi:5'-nucleotidase / UDP-sugar diphosphatase